MSIALPDRLVFIDLETTGARPVEDRITEIGLLSVSKEGVEEWSTLVNPLQAIPPFITQLTGIDAAMLRDAPPFADIADTLQQKLAGGLFIAHNATFDYGFVRNAFARQGLDFAAPSLCTVKLSRRLFPEHRRHGLDVLLERFGLRIENRHRALSDARVVWQLWQSWHQLVPAETLNAAIQSLLSVNEP